MAGTLTLLTKDSYLNLASLAETPTDVMVKRYSTSQEGQLSEEKLKGSIGHDLNLLSNQSYQPVTFKPLYRKASFRKKRWFCCLFPPWSSGPYVEESGDDYSTDSDIAHISHPMLGQEVYHSPTRTQENNPNTFVMDTIDTNIDKNDDESSSGEKRGILRFTSNPSPPPLPTAANSAAAIQKTSQNNPSKRSFLPKTYKDQRSFTSFRKSLIRGRKITFSTMARIVAIRSHTSMTMEERNAQWWTKDDFNSFKRGNVVVTRNIVDGGSAVWLSNQSNPGQANGSASNKAPSDDDDKWWHKYGHSRRGLEQVASVDEARQRQRNIRMASYAVLEEQKRQKTLGIRNPERIAIVAREYTAWAKDLALAAGESDADAVKSNFDDMKRHSREFYLLKHTIASGNAVPKHTPAFMVPKGLSPRFLDANTTSQISYRKKKQKKVRGEYKKMGGKPSPNSKKKPPSSITGSLEKEASVKVRDPELGTSISKRAAGFGGAGTDKVSMAAVMSAPIVERDTSA
mmetsp:Transcript_35359/g.51626  ORF Transcript_35359/g.51626 Transcript_35359/m.51626 type:complete len:514 (+) Transcript_35359:230-1771(+)